MQGERILWLRCKNSGLFVGRPLNYSNMSAQASTLKELEENMIQLMTDVFKHEIEQLKNVGVEMYEEKDALVWIKGSRVAVLERELQKYKDTFGELKQ